LAPSRMDSCCIDQSRSGAELENEVPKPRTEKGL
jgi:hypothetical protein